MSTANPYASPEANTIDSDQETYQPRIFSVQGRIGRIRYLAYSFVTTLLVIVILGIFMGITMAVAGANDDPSNPILMALAALFYLSYFVIYFIMAKRRLNDLDKSGWFSLLNFIPLVNIGLIIYLIFFPGTEGANSYGPQPEKNPIGLVILGVIVPISFFAGLGILAAVAIPAYQDYIKQAQEMQQYQNYDQQDYDQQSFDQ